MIFLFSGLRRRDKKRLNLLFAIFALAYGGTLLNGIRFHNTQSLESFISINRQDTIFVVLAFCALIWYVAEYTKVKIRWILWGVTSIFIATGAANIFRSNMIYDQIIGLEIITLSWGEELTYLAATDSLWASTFLAGQLAVLIYIVYAFVRQFLRGERRDAIILSIGVLWFVATLVAELTGESDLIPLLSYAEFGFLGFVVVASLQMSNEIIKNEEDLADYQENLELLVRERTAELESTQEELLHQTQEQAAMEERGHLARELHDVVTQILFSINIIAMSLPRLWKRDPIMAERSTNELQRLTRGALAEMRILLRELRPQTITSTELGTLLTQLCHSISARHDIPVDVQVCHDCQLPEEVHLALYRIAQEAMNNITKHADAGHLSVELEQNQSALLLTISDDGQGFDRSAVSPENMGLEIMLERAKAVDADLTLESQPGSGTTIIVTWPFHQSGDNGNG